MKVVIYISSLKLSATCKVLKSYKSRMSIIYIYIYIYIYAIMKAMCPPGYHHNGFVATVHLGT